MLFLKSSNTSATATPDDPKSQCSPRIDEESENTEEDNKFILSPPKLLESPPSNCDITPPGSPELTYRHTLKISDPIPIGYVLVLDSVNVENFF